MPPTENPTALGPTHYDLLEVANSASVAELRQAFRQLSKRYHPDTTTLPQAQAQESYRQLQQAYAVLSDPISRSRYDSQLRQPAAPAGGPRLSCRARPRAGRGKRGWRWPGGRGITVAFPLPSGPPS